MMTTREEIVVWLRQRAEICRAEGRKFTDVEMVKFIVAGRRFLLAAADDIEIGAPPNYPGSAFRPANQKNPYLVLVADEPAAEHAHPDAAGRRED
jgi:hypothetical protein